MAQYVFSRCKQQNLRWLSVSICIAFFFIAAMSGQAQIPSVFASPQSTPVPGAPLRGIHLGNHANAENWDFGLLRQVDPRKGGTWPEVIVVLSWQVYNRHRSGPNCRIDSVAIPTSTHASILDYLQGASSAGKRIIIRVMPSPGNFDGNHRLLTTSSSGCNEWVNRSYDDIGDEIIKIHEWNVQNSITEFGFEPASEPNIEWYRNDPNPTPIRLDDPRAWSDMDAYFTAIYDYVHTQSTDPTIRVFTPPMSQGAFAEIRDVSSCVERTLSDGHSHGYEKMPNVYLNGTKNDGYTWHNYWKVGYEAWASCEEAATPRGHHVAYWFPPAMWASMAVNPRIITEADLASPPAVHNGQFGDLSDKDASFGMTAANSLDQFINAEQWAERIAVWTLNVTDPTIETGAEQNWHEAYRCNDVGQDMILSERPWFMRWWAGETPSFSFTPCYRVFLPVGYKDYTTELIKNGSFDAGGAYWTTTTSQASCRYPQYPYSIFRAIDGNNAAELGRCSANTDTLSQIITIPANVASVNLTYKYRVEQSYSQPIYQDYLYAQVHDYATGEVVTLTTRDDRPPRGTWIGNGIDLTSRRGHNVEIIFKASNNSDLWPAHFWIDDVSVQISQ